MKSIIYYLDKLRDETGSDYKAAQLLEISKVSVSQIRKRGSMSDETALKLAELLKEDQAEVLLAAAMARSEGKVKTAWESIGKRAGIAAMLALGLVVSMPMIKSISIVENTHYAMVAMVFIHMATGILIAALWIPLFTESRKWQKRKATFITYVGTECA